MSSNPLAHFDMSNADSPRRTFEHPSTTLNTSLPSVASLGYRHTPSMSTPFNNRQSLPASHQTVNSREDLGWGGLGNPINNPTMPFSPQQNWGQDFPSTPSHATSRSSSDLRSEGPASTPSHNPAGPRISTASTDSSPPTASINGSQVLPLAIKSNINQLCQAYELSSAQNVDLQEFAKVTMTDLPISSVTMQVIQHAAQLKVINQNTTILEKIGNIENRLVTLERTAEKAWKPSKEHIDTMGMVAADIIIRPDRVSYCALDADLINALEQNKEKYELKDIYLSLPKTNELNKAARAKASRTRAQFRRSLLLGILPGQNHATLENWTFTMVSKLKIGGAGQTVELKYLVRAALLRHFARANKDLLQTEDAIDLDGAATTGVTDEGDFESGEPMNPGTSGGSSKRKSRKENGQPAAKKPRGGQGKQPVGAHFFASLDKWLEGLYAKNGTDMNSDTWRKTVNEYLLEDYKLHGHVHHWAFPDSRPPPPAAVSTYQPPQGIYGNLQS